MYLKTTIELIRINNKNVTDFYNFKVGNRLIICNLKLINHQILREIGKNCTKEIIRTTFFAR